MTAKLLLVAAPRYEIKGRPSLRDIPAPATIRRSRVHSPTIRRTPSDGEKRCAGRGGLCAEKRYHLRATSATENPYWPRFRSSRSCANRGFAEPLLRIGLMVCADPLPAAHCLALQLWVAAHSTQALGLLPRCGRRGRRCGRREGGKKVVGEEEKGLLLMG